MYIELMILLVAFGIGLVICLYLELQKQLTEYNHLAEMEKLEKLESIKQIEYNKICEINRHLEKAVFIPKENKDDTQS